GSARTSRCHGWGRSKKKPPVAKATGGWMAGLTGTLEEPLELPATDGMLKFSDSLGLDLADPFPGHLEDPAHLLESVGVAVTQTVAELDDFALAVGQRLEDLVDLLLEHLLGGRVDRALRGFILDEVAEVAVLALADGAVQRDRVAADFHDPPGFLDRDVGGSRRLLDGRLASLLLEQPLGDVTQLRHRLDHVHGDADGAGLVRDRPGNGLANPPGGVGAELVAAAILILVDRAHQPGIAFLDEIQERETAVAVLLGDRHHQSEVAAGKFPLGLLVLFEALVHQLGTPLEALGSLERDPHQILELLDEIGPIFLAAVAGPQLPELGEQLFHADGDLLQPLHEGLDLLGPDRQFLDEVDRLEPAPLEVGHQGQPPGRLALADEDPEVAHVAFHQVLEGLQVMRHPPQDLVLLEVFGNRDLDGPIEGEITLVDLLEHVDNQGQGEVALEHLAAELLAGALDLLGEVDLLFPGEQGNLAHLGQVHANRIVDPSRDVFEILGRELGFLVLEGLLGQIVVGLVIQITRGQQAGFRLVLVDQLNAHLIERLEQAVDALGARRLVGQKVVDLVEGEKPPPFAQLEQRLDALVQLVHPESSLTHGTTGQDASYFVSGRWFMRRRYSNCKARQASGSVTSSVSARALRRSPSRFCRSRSARVPSTPLRRSCQEAGRTFSGKGAGSIGRSNPAARARTWGSSRRSMTSSVRGACPSP